MISDFLAVAVILIVAASTVAAFLLAERDKRRELKRLERVFPLGGKDDN